MLILSVIVDFYCIFECDQLLININIYRHSLVDCGSCQLYLSVCLCVCPAFTAYISLTMGRIFIKLGENVGTSVRLIVLKFEHSAAKGKTTHKG